MKLIKCKVCNHSGETELIEVKEMMFGFDEKFTYFQCPECECLQISETPENISKYYPSDYYSLTVPAENSLKNTIKKIIRKPRNKYAFYNKGIVGKCIYKYFPMEVLRIIASVGNLDKNSTILDIGSGSGSILSDLKGLGFHYLLGVDPFIKEDIEYKNHLKIQKKSIHEVDGKWDLIMFHHSFEHIPDPLETLESATRLLNDGGTCLIRIPTASSYAWEHYRENWVQLDVPRHYFLHSIKSIEYLAEKTGLEVEKIIYDSTDFQFWGSEQNIKGITLMDPRSRFVNTKSLDVFSQAEIAQFKQKAELLNREKQGDSIAVFLRKKGR